MSNAQRLRPMKRIDGMTFGRWTVLDGYIKEGRYGMARVLCACGVVKLVQRGNLLNGTSRSCGCLKMDTLLAHARTHGKSKTRTYSIWLGMRDRCRDEKDRRYSDYGARGIRVCEQWSDFAQFLSDMGEAPPSMSIDRINNDGDYEPTNCRWATPAEQARNRRSNIIVTIDGETGCLLDWTKRFGLPYKLVRARIRVLGWEPVRALTEPAHSCSTRRLLTSAR